MRSCLFLGVFAALLTFCTTVSTAQIDTARPVRGVVRPAAPAEPSVEPVAVPRAGGMTVSRDTKLTAGDEITVKIVEDRDPVLPTIVTDTGEVQINGLGSVYIAGKSSMEAESTIASYLRQKYYHQATVEVRVVRKAVGTVRPHKAMVAGKVNRPGPQYFTEANPLKLSESIIGAGNNLYSEIRKVRLTRGGRTTEYNVEQIIKEGRTDLDMPLHDGDQIFVPAKSIIFRSGD